MHELFMSILVHDSKQKKNYFDFANYRPSNFLTIFLTFLDFKKFFSMKSGQLFQCGNTIQNGDSRIQP